MHSSRTRTARLLPVSPSLHCTGEVSVPGGVSAPGGVCSRGVSAPREGVCSGGCLLLGGVSQHAMGQTPHVYRILDTRY